jgi:hypothetical protein
LFFYFFLSCLHSLQDLESEVQSQVVDRQPVKLTFKRKAHGMHAASARKLAAEATRFLSTVIVSTGGALESSVHAIGHGVGTAVKKAFKYDLPPLT